MSIIQRVWVSRLPVSPDASDPEDIGREFSELFHNGPITGVAMFCGSVIFIVTETPEDRNGPPPLIKLRGQWAIPELLSECIRPERLIHHWSYGVVTPHGGGNADPDETDSGIARVWGALPPDATTDDLAIAFARSEDIITSAQAAA